MNRALSVASVVLILVSTVATVQAVDFQSFQIIIKPDGSVNSLMLERNGTTYTFKGDIYDAIVVQINNITIDGAGYTLRGGSGANGNKLGIHLTGSHASNIPPCTGVLVKNLTITNMNVAIQAFSGCNNSFIGNTFDGGYIQLWGNVKNASNLFKYNTFKDSSMFLDYNSGMRDFVTENNFFDSFIFVGIAEEPTVDRNYWSNYTAKYPNAKEVNNTGTWDTPYVDDNIRGNYVAIDYHPLVNPVTDFQIPDSTGPSTTPSPTSQTTPTPSISPSPTLAPTNSPTPTATVPELPALATILAIATATTMAALAALKRKTTKRLHDNRP